MEQMEGWPDGWTLVEKIGGGSYGSVYKAKKEMLGRTYFRAVKHISVPKDEEELKCMQDDLGTEEEDVLHAFCEMKMQSILQEFDLLREFSGHRHFVQVFDANPVRKKGMPGYDLYIHMELLSSIRSRFQHAADPEAEAVRLGIDICEALSEMHTRKLMHRDIKNENILVNSDGVYKLADFGEACQLSGSATNMTIRGTMDYMAPEMLLGRAVGYTADLYGLGLVLYRLVNHNRFPFSREGEISRQGANMKRISGEPVPTPDLASEAFASVILRALAFDPKDRWQHAEDMGRALREIAETGKPTDEVHKKIQAKPLIGIYQIQDEKAVAYTEDTTFDLSTLQPGTYASFLFRLSNDSETPLKITSACARIDGGKELGWGGFS
ncbi:MAG: serine/threonine protein kinase, partial [Clostridia bacterium]|nr:serine/threonine protein kinase [Clostridia bacterium]